MPQSLTSSTLITPLPPKRPVDVKQGKMNMSTAPKLDLKTWNFDPNSEPQKKHSVYFVVMPHK